MPDIEELNQIKMLADLMKSMPPAKGSNMRIPFGIESKRIEWATELVRDYGVRVHPELGGKDMVSDGPIRYGNVTTGIDATRSVDKLDLKSLTDMLRSAAPNVPSLATLADDIDAALASGDPDQVQALRDRIAKEQPDVIATARQMAASTPPEAYEQ